jgi:hypothetical protein
MADEALEEHREVKEVLADLDRMQAYDPQFDPKITGALCQVLQAEV